MKNSQKTHSLSHMPRLTSRTVSIIGTTLTTIVLLLSSSPVAALTAQERMDYAYLGIEFIDSPCPGTGAAAASTPSTSANVDVTARGNHINPAAPIIQDLLKAQTATGVPAAVLLAQGAFESGDAGWWDKAKVDDTKAQKYSYFNGGGQHNLNEEFKSYDTNPLGHGPMQLDNWTGSYAGVYSAKEINTFVKDAQAQFGAATNLDPNKIGDIAMMFDTSILYAAIHDAGILPGGVTPASATVDQWVEVLKQYGTLHGASQSVIDSWKAVEKQIAAALGGAAAGSSPTPATSCCPANTTPGSGVTNAGGTASTDGTDSAGNEYRFLVSKGLTPMVAAAITGNAIWESGGNQTKLTEISGASSQNSIGARGIHQWYAGRANALVAFAAKRGMPWYGKDTKSGYDLQLDFLWVELTTSHASNLADTKRQPDIASATTTFEATFEVSGATNTYPARIALAKKVLQTFGNGAGGPSAGSGTPTGTGNTACPDSTGLTSVGDYKNPLRDVKGLVRERIDEGVDYAGTGPVYAIGTGTVIAAYKGNSPYWGGYGGYDVTYTLSNGPAQGKNVYFAENCKPEANINVGTPVTSSTVICTMYNGGSGVETGWAYSPGYPKDFPLAYPYYTKAGNPDGSVMAYGLNFSQFMKSIGAPPGDQSRSVDPTKVVADPPPGPLPAGWPKW